MKIEKETKVVILQNGNAVMATQYWTIVNKVDRRREKNQKSSSN